MLSDGDDYMDNEKTLKVNKFESEDRLKELNISGNLKTLGFSNNMTLADIGSGTGILVFEASKYNDSKIYSVEMSDVMIDIQKDRMEEGNIKNIDIIKQDVDENKILIDDKTCDVVSMVTVLHEIDNKDNIVKEISRILKPNGKFLVIELHKKKTDFGPPVEERLSIEEIESISTKVGLNTVKKTTLGPNFYSIILQKL